jgi:hypothetical protein
MEPFLGFMLRIGKHLDKVMAAKCQLISVYFLSPQDAGLKVLFALEVLQCLQAEASDLFLFWFDVHFI